MANPPLSVAIVCKNASRTIRATLESVRGLGASPGGVGGGAPQIVALDSGSTDGTLEILAEFRAEIHRVQWRGFAQTKNAAADACAGDWILHLDADESLTPELRASVADALAKNDPSISAFEMNRKVWWAGGFLHHAWQPEWRLRLTRRGVARWAGLEPHPSLQLIASATPGRVARLPDDLRHDAFVSMDEFLTKAVGYAREGAQAYLATGKRGSALDLLVSPLAAWFKQAVIKQGWRDGWRGMAAASAMAAHALMKHTILFEMARRTRSSDGPMPPK